MPASSVAAHRNRLESTEYVQLLRLNSEIGRKFAFIVQRCQSWMRERLKSVLLM